MAVPNKCEGLHLFLSLRNLLLNCHQDKVSNLYDDASKAILKQATDHEGASSEEIKGASEAVFGGAVNLIKSADVKQKKPEEVMISAPEKSFRWYFQVIYMAVCPLSIESAPESCLLTFF